MTAPLDAGGPFRSSLPSLHAAASAGTRARVNARSSHAVETAEPLNVIDAAAVLGVSPFVDARRLRSCYRRLLLEHHPDRHAGIAQEVHEQRTREIVAAFNLLDARISAAEERFRTSCSLADSARLHGLRRAPGRLRSLAELAGYVCLALGVLTGVYAVVPL